MVYAKKIEELKNNFRHEIRELESFALKSVIENVMTRVRLYEV